MADDDAEHDAEPGNELGNELDARLRNVRPPTVADDGWTASAEGHAALAGIADRAAQSGLGSLRRGGAIAAALIAAAAAVVAIALAASDTETPGKRNGPAAITGPGSVAVARTLASYDTCASALHDLRAHAVAHPEAYTPRVYPLNVPAATSGNAVSAASAAPAHSSTNNQETGVDEPDVVQTDGRHVYSLTGGTLRVTDVATRRVTGTLALTNYAGGDSATMLLSGHRLLIVLSSPIATGPIAAPGTALPSGVLPGPRGSTYLLVDVAAAPRVVSTFRPNGGYLDARLVHGQLRLVVDKRVTLGGIRPGHGGAKEDDLATAPLTTWQPTWSVTTDGKTTHGRVPCDALVHPTDYTGADLLTVYTVDPARGFGDVAPLTLAADGTTVYASTSSLYVTSSDTKSTEIHRFDVAARGRPGYVGSGTVPGYVTDSYSLSDYAGTLRVVTSSAPDNRGQASAVYTLDDATMRTRGHVGGLGRDEQTYGVRFAGPLAFVVTFRTVDPLYVLDLSDPDRPRAAGKLTLGGVSQYLHVTSNGRLLGVGLDADAKGIARGGLVSLFDVHDPAHPKRLDRVTRADTFPAADADPHAFQYWAPTHTAFVPLVSSGTGYGTRVLVLRVGRDTLSTAGTITNPGSRDASGVERTLVIGSSIWTLSPSGLQVSAGSTLARQAWIPFT